MDEVSERCFLSNSNRSLLDDTNAISSPEKKAEKTNERKIKLKLFKMINAICWQTYIKICDL